MASDTRRGELYEPTDEQRAVVAALAQTGLSQPEIARFVIDALTDQPISDKTLRKHFRAELNSGKEIANARVKVSLFEMATKGKQVAAAIFWAKTQMGWKEPAQDINLHQTYGELVQAAAKKAEDEKKAKLALIQGGKAA